MTIVECYDKFKHLDALLSDETIWDTPRSYCLGTCWKVIKEAALKDLKEKSEKEVKL